MTLKLRPLADRVIVEPIERDETFAGGALVLPLIADLPEKTAPAMPGGMPDV
jgi:co-chaperonin GroES (HSP10)